MKRGTYFRLLALSVVSALFLSVLSLFLLIRLTDIASSRHRNEFISFFVDNIERKTAHLSFEELKSADAKELLQSPFPFGRPPGGPPPPPPDGMMGPPPMGPPPGEGKFRPPGPRMQFWLVSDSGEILNSSDATKPLPQAWAQLPKSDIPREIATQEDFLRLKPSINIVKLNRTPTVYFIMVEDRRPFFGPLFLTQAGITFVMIMMALVMAFSLVFFYLRRKSLEARAVLLRLERGDLKARFEIQRIDEFGGLLLDFNRMAHEIERLVTRVNTTETTRKNLLQELGHDLRTPLTSLATSFEMLRMHYDKMSITDREDLFEMTAAEVEYFKDLLEKLMTIAALDEPNYKQSTEMIYLRELLNQELKTRQNNSKITWQISQAAPEELFVTGDVHLILRLFKNAFDNAGRYAKSKVEVEIRETTTHLEIHVQDDGPGLSQKEIDSFAKRREQRTRREGDKLNFSLGLGSVIMKAIAESHDGSVEIRNRSQAGTAGADLVIRLPKVRPAGK
jgi:signal transduction histidine kinase